MTTELPETATASPWCQRWNQRCLSWQLAHPSERFDSRRYEVHPLAEEPARAFVLAHHYSGSYPAASRRYGLYRGQELVGAAVFSIPVQARVLTIALPDLEPYVQSLELGRFVLADSEPGNAESWFLARCHEDLLTHGVRGVVSFADPVPRHLPDGTVLSPGHVGWIYQATNAIYCGRGKARILAQLPDGSVFSDRAKQKILREEKGRDYAERKLVSLGARPMRAGENPAAWLHEALDAVGAQRLRHRGCHRYVFQIGRNQRDRSRVRVGLDALAYPKTGDAAA